MYVQDLWASEVVSHLVTAFDATCAELRIGTDQSQSSAPDMFRKPLHECTVLSSVAAACLGTRTLAAGFDESDTRLQGLMRYALLASIRIYRQFLLRKMMISPTHQQRLQVFCRKNPEHHSGFPSQGAPLQRQRLLRAPHGAMEGSLCPIGGPLVRSVEAFKVSPVLYR